MSMIKRSFLTIKRKWKENILLLIIVLILGSAVAASISVNHAINNSSAILHSRIPPLVFIEYDHHAAWRAYQDSEYCEAFWHNPELEFSPELYQKIIEHPSVFDIYSPSDYQSWLLSFDLNEPFESIWGWFPEDEEGGVFPVRGVNQVNFTDLRLELIEIVEGRNFTESELLEFNENNPVILSNDFAIKNNLHVGDTFELIDQHTIWDFSEGFVDFTIDPEPAISYERTLSFEIIGLFSLAGPIEVDIQIDNDGRPLTSRIENRILNQLYVPATVVNNIRDKSDYLHCQINPETPMCDSERHFQSDIFIQLSDASYIEEFYADIEPYLPSFWRIRDLSHAFTDIVGATEVFDHVASLVFWGAKIAAVVFLGLVLVFQLKNRLSEVGIYLALGFNKRKIFFQFLLEYVMIVSVALIFSIFD